MSAYSFSLFLIPPLVKKLLFPRIERRLLTQIGTFVLSFSLLAYGIEYYLPHPLRFLFTFLSTFTRFVEGVGAAIALTSFLSLAFSLYPGQTEHIFVLRSLGTAGGYSVGLIISFFAYQLLGYFGLFAMLALIAFLVSLTLLLFRRSPILPSQEQAESVLGFWKVLKIRRVWLTIVHNQVTGMIILFCEPTIALKLSHDFGYTESTIQLYIMAYAVAATLGAVLALVLENRVDRRLQIVIGTVIIMGGVTLVGPSKVLHFPNLPQLPAIGLALAGLAKSQVMIASFPDAAVGGIQEFPEHRQEVSDIVTSTSVSMLGMNSLISPLLSSALNKYCGFRAMMDWLLLIQVISGVAYITSTLTDWAHEARISRSHARTVLSEDLFEEGAPLNRKCLDD